MTLTLQLPNDLESELTSEAARLGIPLADYAVQVLEKRRSPMDNIRTGADLVAYWRAIGVLGSLQGVTDPAAYAQQIRADAERRGKD